MQVQDREKGTTGQMVAIVFLNFLLFCQYLLPVAFLPEISARLDVSKTTTGLIIGFFPFGSMISTLLVGKYQGNFGKTKIISFLCYCCFLSLISFSIAMGTSHHRYIWISIFARFLQGFAIGGICAILYSYVPLLFPDNQVQVIGYLELSVGIGMSLGNNLGFLINYILGSPQETFFILAFIYLALLKFFASYLPEIPQSKKTPISYKPLFTNFQFLIVFVIGILSVGVQIFIFVGNSYEMIAFQHLNTSLLNNGTLLSLYTAVYTISCLLMTSKAVQRLSLKFWILFGFILLIIALTFLSRQSFFGFPKDLEYIVPGIVLGGFGNGPAIIFFMPLLMVFGNQAAKEGSLEQVDDMISSIYILSLSWGELVGPLLVSTLFQYYSYEFACYVLQGIVITTLLCYVIFCKEDESKQYKGEDERHKYRIQMEEIQSDD